MVAMAIWWAPAKDVASVAMASAALAADPVGLTAAADLAVTLTSTAPGQVTIRRESAATRPGCTFELLRSSAERAADAPGGVTRFALAADPAEVPFVDDTAADGLRYTYALEAHTGNAVEIGPAGDVETPRRALPQRLGAARLVIDKPGYTLTVLDGNRAVRRYHVALGADPVRRKLFQDNATTPEGEYRIRNVQSRATYYRAYDLDYPTVIDRQRHAAGIKAGTVPMDGILPRPIGGEIQIHGGGVARDWTHGCIALRNGDIDELMGHAAIRRGTRVTIYGSEMKPPTASRPAGT